MALVSCFDPSLLGRPLQFSIAAEQQQSTYCCQAWQSRALDPYMKAVGEGKYNLPTFELWQPTGPGGTTDHTMAPPAGVNALVLALMASQGNVWPFQGPSLELWPSTGCGPDTATSGCDEFYNLHAQCLATSACLIEARSDPVGAVLGFELVMVPVFATKGPVFWVFEVPTGILHAVAHLLQQKAVHVTLDLNRVLFKVFGASELEARSEALRSERLDVEAKLKERISQGQDVTLLDLELNLLVEQQKWVDSDLQLLDKFVNCADPSTFCVEGGDGQTFSPPFGWIPVPDADTNLPSPSSQAQRPVVVLAQQPAHADSTCLQHIVLTQVDLEDPDTRFLMRIRPGAGPLLATLQGTQDGSGGVVQRFETSVTSHAGLVHSLIASSCSSLEFAMSNGWVTSGGVLTSGLLAVPQGQLRGLLPVLQRATPELPDQLGVPRLPVPLGVVISHGGQNWDAPSREALLQVQSFDPYRDVATLNLAPDKVPVEARQQALASAKELVQACATLRNVHQQTYATVSEFEWYCDEWQQPGTRTSTHHMPGYILVGSILQQQTRLQQQQQQQQNQQMPQPQHAAANLGRGETGRGLHGTGQQRRQPVTAVQLAQMVATAAAAQGWSTRMERVGQMGRNPAGTAGPGQLPVGRNPATGRASAKQHNKLAQQQQQQRVLMPPPSTITTAAAAAAAAAVTVTAAEVGSPSKKRKGGGEQQRALPSSALPAAATGAQGIAHSNPAKRRVSIGLAYNLYFEHGSPPPAKEVRTPPKAQPKGSALKPAGRLDDEGVPHAAAGLAQGLFAEQPGPSPVSQAATGGDGGALPAANTHLQLPVGDADSGKNGTGNPGQLPHATALQSLPAGDPIRKARSPQPRHGRLAAQSKVKSHKGQQAQQRWHEGQDLNAVAQEQLATTPSPAAWRDAGAKLRPEAPLDNTGGSSQS